MIYNFYTATSCNFFDNIYLPKDITNRCSKRWYVFCRLFPKQSYKLMLITESESFVLQDTPLGVYTCKCI